MKLRKKKHGNCFYKYFPQIPGKSWKKKIITHKGKRGTYIISPYTQTEIRSNDSGRCLAYACMQLSIPTPTFDRMVAEYILIINAEDVYWKTANIFSQSGNEFRLAEMLLSGFDIALLLNLLFEILTAP